MPSPNNISPNCKDEEKRCIYYSHSMKIYDTIREEKEVALISGHFPKSTIYNPNNKLIQAADLPMTDCLAVISRDATTDIVFSVYLGHVGKGVYTEIEEAWIIHKPIYVIQEGKIIPFTNWRIRLIDIDWAVKYGVVERER